MDPVSSGCMEEWSQMGNSPASFDHVLEDEAILDFDVSDEALEATAGMEGGPHKTGCTPDCPAYSC